MRTKLKRIMICCVVLAFCLEGLAGSAAAHKVTVFAWVEGNMVYTQSKFAGGRKAKNAAVEVYDQAGKKLLEGKTDEQGEFSFPAPGKMEMKVVLVAGTGHQGEWVIPESDFADMADAPAQTEPEPSAAVVSTTAAPMETGNQTAAAACVTREEVRQIVDAALDKKLRPISMAVHKLNDPDHAPSVSDIAGGIGYILGLVGVASYVHSRRKRDTETAG